MASRKWTFGKSAADTVKEEEDLEQILVFGYGCKLFRDDEKAEEMDSGGHLIPWMGDPSVTIDRYDGRGHLYDLSRYDADKLRSSGRMSELTEEEKHIEALCDEERYMELHSDVQEKALHEEEELKRLNEALNETDSYSAVGFSYENQHYMYDPEEPTPDPPPEELEPEVTDIFEAPVELKVPGGMLIPPTNKLNMIIMKTASFISKHSTQMEIMIKTKQTDNEQFDFLHFDHYLNPYYKHVVSMIKQGKYQPVLEPTENRRRSEDEHYLHPSLSNIPESPSSESFLSSVQSKLPPGQLHSTLYAKLVKNIGKHTGRSSPLPNLLSTLPALPVKPALSAVTATTHVSTSPLVTATENTDNSRSTVEGALGVRSNLPPVPGTEPVRLPIPLGEQEGAVSSKVGEPPPPGTVPVKKTRLASEEPAKRSKVKSSIAPSSLPIVPPPPDLQPIVDKMAMYVARNGIEFEIVVKSKTDSRFDFIQSWHQYYPYYRNKRMLFQEEIAESKSEGKTQAKAVAFTIKPKEVESNPIGQRRALLTESSDDDDEEDSATSDNNSRSREKYEYNHSSISTAVSGNDSVSGYNRTSRPQISAEEAERKQAEERLKDRLSVAAREKLAQTSKEKQIQAERKRKAAMFLSSLKSSGVPAPVLPGAAGCSPARSVSPAADEPSGSDSDSSESASSSSDSDESHVESVREFSPAPAPFIPSSPQSQLTADVMPRSPPSVTSSANHSPAPISMSRTRSPKLRSRSKSPRRNKHRSKTPPSAYLRIRRSPVRRRSRSRSPRHRPKHDPALIHKSRSHHHSNSYRMSRSPTSKSSRSSKQRRSRSRSKSKPIRKRSRSKSATRNSKSKSKKRRRSRSKTRKSSKSPNKPKKSHKKHKSKSKRSKSRSPSRSKRAKSPSSKKSSRIGSPDVAEGRLSIVAEENSISDAVTQLPISQITEDNNRCSFLVDSDSEASSIASSTTSAKPVSQDLLSKVRAMLQAVGENGSPTS